MNEFDIEKLNKFIEENVGTFHEKRVNGISKIKLKDMLNRKNPYLFRAKNLGTPQEVVKGFLDAHISSNEETLFGEFLERLAIFVCSEVYKGNKSTGDSTDLDFEKDGIRYLVSIKSGPNWGNSSQIQNMEGGFDTIKKRLGTNASKQNVVAVYGCCYGKKNSIKPRYMMCCGQSFWEFISGDSALYKKIILPLGYKEKEFNENFEYQYNLTLDRLTKEFSKKFCTDEDKVDWERLVEFNSSSFDSKKFIREMKDKINQLDSSRTDPEIYNELVSQLEQVLDTPIDEKDESRIYEILSEISIAQGKYAEAICYLNNELNINTGHRKHDKIYRLLGEISVSHGEEKEAIYYLNKAFDINPKSGVKKLLKDLNKKQ